MRHHGVVRPGTALKVGFREEPGGIVSILQVPRSGGAHTPSGGWETVHAREGWSRLVPRLEVSIFGSMLVMSSLTSLLFYVSPRGAGC